MGGYHEYTDVKSCQDVIHLYHLLWSATILNIVALFLGIITAAVLGGFKDMVRPLNEHVRFISSRFSVIAALQLLHQCTLFLHQTPAPASESTSEPEAITAPVPSEIPPPTTSLNPYYNTAPCLPPYSAYDLQVCSCFKGAVEKCVLLIIYGQQSSSLSGNLC